MSRCFLIVDDDLADRKHLRRLLARLDPAATILEAGDAEAALETEAREIAMIFLDYLLPEASGVELIAPLAGRWPRAAICMMTGQGDEEIAKESIRRGAADYLPKRSLTPEALSRAIDTGCKIARMRWQLDEKREDLSMFSEVLVHDLRAPIRSMRFLVEKLEEDLAEGAAREVSRDVRLIGKSADRLHDLVTSLAGHVHYDHETEAQQISAAELIEDACQALLAEISRSRARITVAAEGRITCHGPQLVQLLQNLIGNAIKYAGEAAPEISIRCRDSAEGLHFEVADKGVGVQPEHRDTIFLPFKRLPVSAAIPGTGLGLATCRKIVERHGGRIWCDSEVTEGTTIHVSLPHQGMDLARSA